MNMPGIAHLFLPDSPALAAGYNCAALLTPDGEVVSLSAEAVAAHLRGLGPPLLVHATNTLRRLGLPSMPTFDLLELFAFARPAQSAPPTARGLCLALDLPVRTGHGLEAEAASLPAIAAALLRHLAAGRALPATAETAGIAARMGKAGWGWAPFVLAALGQPDAPPADLRIWSRLPEWEDLAPPPPPAAHPISEAEARARLAAVLGPAAEQRPTQADYAGAATIAFAPRDRRGDPTLVLAEAGTGTGKTLGYLAPASLWAERNHGTVWISTFTKHLQRQIATELARLQPDPVERRRRVVIRKGRENYLCLLNFEDEVRAAAASLAPRQTILLGLVARWALQTSEGDLQGGDLPGWLAELFGPASIFALADRRGECIHAGCPHWRRCFVEHTIRRARSADLVIANHALVMAQAAWGGLDDNTVPLRYVFDEGHHLFDAADGTFSAELSGRETAELRRWLLGAEGTRSRARGLFRRIEDLVASQPELDSPLHAALAAARALPAPGWPTRLAATTPELAGLERGRPNPTEAFLYLLRNQLLARANGKDDRGPAALECDLYPVIPGLPEAALHLANAYAAIAEPLATLRRLLATRLADEAETVDTPTRNRIEGLCRSLTRRAIDPLSVWQAMLRDTCEGPPEPGARRDYVSFLRLNRDRAGDRDVGLHRHWLDPTIPLVSSLARPAHGLLITSATLRDESGDDAEAAWALAEIRVGAPHLPSPAIRAAVASPFDYRNQTRAFIVTDVSIADIASLAAAYRALFIAAGGGALGLFTAIRRLQAVHALIAADLEATGIPLLAQHVDAMDNATLLDIFRTEEATCLLGTDAMRDGVDVPGRALRLVVFERVPWPRPDILHRERRIHLSGGDPKAYDDRIARLRLRQAFGRLIRNAADRGVFVLLDRQTPSRLLSAFPDNVIIRRVGLAQAARETHTFLQQPLPEA
jgi:ATP-dependent DNA helicase DinG